MDSPTVPKTALSVPAIRRHGPTLGYQSPLSPLFSADGTQLVFRAQKQPGYEADRWELMLVETDPSGHFKGKPRSITPDFDGGVDDFVNRVHLQVRVRVDRRRVSRAWS